MKIIGVLSLLVILITSCEKERDFNLFDKKEKPCATVNTEALPENLKSNFSSKYMGATNVTWYDKDETAYCALFTFNGKETKATFDRNGNFSSEETEDEEDDDNEKEDKGCECDFDNND